MTTRIDRLWPDPADELHDGDLIADLDHEGVRFNFVTSVDGAATRDGLSGGLGGPADQRLFELLRRVADVVVVGAGTVRAEGYGPMRVSDPSVAWRVAHSRGEHPVFAIVSATLDLDPASPIFTTAPVRPVLITTDTAARSRFAEVADVVVAGSATVDPVRAVELLRERGLRRILCEGGPSLFGDFIAAGAVDELCVTVSPTLEAGDAPRIAHGAPGPQELKVATVLKSGSTLLIRYSAAPAG